MQQFGSGGGGCPIAGGLTPLLRGVLMYQDKAALPVSLGTGEVLSIQEEQDQPHGRGDQAGGGERPCTAHLWRAPLSMQQQHDGEGQHSWDHEEGRGEEAVPLGVARALKLQLHQLLHAHQHEAEDHVGRQRAAAQARAQAEWTALLFLHASMGQEPSGNRRVWTHAGGQGLSAPSVHPGVDDALSGEGLL